MELEWLQYVASAPAAAGGAYWAVREALRAVRRDIARLERRVDGLEHRERERLSHGASA